MRLRLAFPLLAALLAGAALAQPIDLPLAAATTTIYPPGVKVITTPLGPAYGNRKGLTLYGLDMRTLLRAGPDPAQYCTGPCAEQWEPLLAPKGALPNIEFPKGGGSNQPIPTGFVRPQQAPDWTIIAGPQGPQWVYKGWHLIFTRRGDKRAATEFDGAEARSWNVLRFIPPLPSVIAPSGVKPQFVEGAYALTDKDGRLLFTGTCAAPCTWSPFAGGMASAGVGAWKIDSAGDSPQWTLHGVQVFVSSNASEVPTGGKVLRP
jgi:predicted lipoprotein with Yx(FWY)xxD motif